MLSGEIANPALRKAVAEWVVHDQKVFKDAQQAVLFKLLKLLDSARLDLARPTTTIVAATTGSLDKAKSSSTSLDAIARAASGRVNSQTQ